MARIRIALWVVVAVGLFGLGALLVTQYASRPDMAGATGGAAPGAQLGGAFSLVDAEGQPATEAIFRGKPSVTLFGFTHCPDVCPTGLMQMTVWADQLGADADKLRFVFVTVDPERDTPETMKAYVSAFSDRIIGVTGDPAAVQAMTRDYKIFSRKAPLGGGDYTMDHTASMILQDAEGNFVGTIDTKEPPETGLAKLKKLIAG